MFNFGKMKLAVVKIYTDFFLQREAQANENHQRFLALSEFLGIPAAPSKPPAAKKAAEDDESRRLDTELEKKKTERQVGQHGMNEAFSRVFKDMIEDYLPGGYFRDEDVKNIANDFYRMAYARIKEMLPKRLSYKLKEENVTNVNPTEISFSPELINKIITDAVVYFHENPDEIKDGLIRAYSSKSKDEDDRHLGVAQVFFSPRIDDSTYAEMLKDAEATGEDPDVKPGDVDPGVLENLKDRDTV
jgi:hypothetical protein